MPFFERTSDQIISNSLERLSQYTNITELSPGGKTRVLLDIVSDEQGFQHQRFDENLAQPFIKKASSRFLDFIGDMMNLPRREATHAYASDDNFNFYVSSGTFGDINSGSGISIPAGTIVSTVPNDSQVVTPGLTTQPSIEYRTTAAATASASQSIIYVPIRAYIEGATSNVPRNVLRQHEITTYTGAANNSLKCTNRYSVSNGEERESDDSYRYRLQNIFKAREFGTPIAIRLALLSLPGVADLKEVLCEQGPGTYSIYVQSLTPTPSLQLIRECAAVAYTVSSFGVRPFVLAPESLGLEMVCQVNWSTKATSEDITRGYIEMRNALENKLNHTKIGAEVELAELSDVMLSAVTYASSIGSASPNKFEEVYVHRRNPEVDGASLRSRFSNDRIIPLYNERVILETSSLYRGIRFLTRQ